ncbi:hypothetical protein J4052_28725 [Bacillus toyonensis]|nr:hypothetical protein [Bacillus toyonensis]
MSREKKIKQLTDRKHPRPVQTLLNQFGDKLDLCVYYCAHIQLLLQESGKITEKHAPIPTALIHFQDTLDSIAIVVRKGNTSGVQTLLRTLFEASLTLQYLLTAPEKKGVIAYAVGHAKSEMNFRKILDPTKGIGRSMLATMERELGEAPTLPPYNYEEAVKHLKTFLDKDWVKPVAREYARVKRNNNGKDPNWYSLYGGPKNIRKLAKKLECETFYNLLYSKLSRHQHASGSLSSIRSVNGIGVLPGIRNLDGLQQELIWVMKIVCLTFEKIFNSYFPDELKNFNTWEVGNLTKFMNQLEGPNIFSVEHLPVHP